MMQCETLCYHSSGHYFPHGNVAKHLLNRCLLLLQLLHMCETHMTDVKCRNEVLLVSQACAKTVTYDGNTQILLLLSSLKSIPKPEWNTCNPQLKNDNMTDYY